MHVSRHVHGTVLCCQLRWRGGCVGACCGCLISSVLGVAPGCGVCCDGAA